MLLKHNMGGEGGRGWELPEEGKRDLKLEVQCMLADMEGGSIDPSSAGRSHSPEGDAPSACEEQQTSLKNRKKKEKNG
jgi:hypothetical protein